MGTEAVHLPVLRDEVLVAAQPVWQRKASPLLVDGTAGAGGHAHALLSAAPPDARLLAVDRDREAVVRAARRLAPFGERARVVHRSYTEIGTLLGAERKADLLLVDLGLSSDQLADPARGFSFQREGPLDMRFDTAGDAPTAAEFVDAMSDEELASALRTWGEVPRAGRVARAMKEARAAGRLATTRDLARVVESAGLRPRKGKIHAATLVFQALRVVANDELGHLRRFLAESPRWLAEGGRLLVIAFHSLEDRLVKHAMRFWQQGPAAPPGVPLPPFPAVLRLVGRKPVRTSDAEAAANPRARSARLRVAERTGAPVPAGLAPLGGEAA